MWCSCGVIKSTVGAYPRGTGSNPVVGNGHFFPRAVISIFRLSLSLSLSLSFSLTHTHTRSRARTHTVIHYWCIGVVSFLSQRAEFNKQSAKVATIKNGDWKSDNKSAARAGRLLSSEHTLCRVHRLRQEGGSIISNQNDRQ